MPQLGSGTEKWEGSFWSVAKTVGLMASSCFTLKKCRTVKYKSLILAFRMVENGSQCFNRWQWLDLVAGEI